MKKIIRILGVMAFLYGGCSSSDHVREFIPGRYVRADSGEYSTVEDTLVIAFLSGDICSINRRIGYRKIRDGVILPKEFHSEKWTGHYDAEAGQLTETRRGRVLTFEPDDGTLRLEAAEYRKIK